MKDLVEVAMAARANAHAPYSKFYVGAAMRDENGKIHGGCNIENAAYPQGWCAECSAISALVMSGAKSITEVAVMGN
ncbi:MAG: cytidine deaminase, partial [Aestuariivirga sp.]